MARKTPSVLIALALVVNAGCYTYVPTTPSQPEPGSDVIAYVSDAGAAQLVTALGPGVTELGGMLLDREEESLSVLVSWYRSSRAGDILSAGNSPVRLSIRDITAIEQKRLSKGKSVLLGVAFIGGAVLAHQIVTKGGRLFGDEDDEEPTPTQIVVPLSRFLRLPIW